MSKAQAAEHKSSKTSNPTSDDLPSGSNDVDKRRVTVPHILQPQQSFEKRYSQIINRQILETSINRRVLQRQVNVFFGFPASPTRTTPDEELKADITEKTDQIKTSSSYTELVPKDI